MIRHEPLQRLPAIVVRDSRRQRLTEGILIRGLMSVLFNHAIRWGFTDQNPISGPNKGAGVRQSSKRQSIPDILDVEYVQRILGRLRARERLLLFLAMATGLRQGELAGLQWKDIDFENLPIDVNKSVVYQVVGPCKTEASKRPVPLDEYTAQDLREWYRQTPYRNPEDWVFASNSRRAGSKRGKQPLLLQTIMRCRAVVLPRSSSYLKHTTSNQ